MIDVISCCEFSYQISCFRNEFGENLLGFHEILRVQIVVFAFSRTSVFTSNHFLRNEKCVGLFVLSISIELIIFLSRAQSCFSEVHRWCPQVVAYAVRSCCKISSSRWRPSSPRMTGSALLAPSTSPFAKT